MEVGKPCSANVWATAASAVSAVRSARTQRASRTEVPLSMILSVSTTCCFLPCGSAGTLEASLKSSCRGSHRRGAFDWLRHSWKARGNASVFPQESVNGAGRFRQPQLPFFYGFIPIQIIEDGDADPACGPALLGDRPGSLKVDLSPEGRVWQADDEGHGRAFQDSEI